MSPAWFLGFVWSLPNTLVGLVLGALTFQRPRLYGGAIVFDRGPRGLTSVMLALHRVAMTVGFVIVSSQALEGRLLAHEQHHVRQSMRLGPLFIPTYLGLGLVYGYRRHPMERAARRAAGESD
jgi:hypothetical protein